MVRGFSKAPELEKPLIDKKLLDYYYNYNRKYMEYRIFTSTYDLPVGAEVTPQTPNAKRQTPNALYWLHLLCQDP
jgi:hypothetical protein